MNVKALVKILIVCVILSVTACTNKTAQQGSPNNSTSAASSPSAASSSTAASSPTAETSAKATKIEVTAKEMAFQLSSTTAPVGLVEFVVKNVGKEAHEFVVLKNDLSDKKLPLKGNSLDENAKGFKNLGEIGENKLKSGATETLKVNLTPGRYLLVCNLPGHFKAGMKAEFTVK